MNINFLRKAPARAVFGFAAILLSPAFQSGAWGQGPQDNGGPPPPQFGGGQRMGGGRAPFATGTVSAVDATAGTITIASPFGGNSQTIQTSSTTQIVSQVTATVADLKAGDQVQVQGIPTGITASSLSIGQSPFPTGGFGGPGGRVPTGGAGAAGGQGGAAGGQGEASASNSFATASGTVLSTSPLTISLGSGVALTLKMTASAKITKFSTVALSGLKVGDRIVGLGQTGDDGTFTATTVAVNMEMGNMGFGQRGRGGFNGNGRNRRNRQNDGQAQNGNDQNAMPMPPPQNGAPADGQAMMMPPPDNQAQMPPPPTNGDAGQ